MKKLLLATLLLLGVELQGAAAVNRAQNALLPKINKFLKTYSPHIEFPDTVFKGVCNGLSLVWAYGKRLEDEQNNLPNPKADDSFFFEQVCEWLLVWDGISPLPRDQKEAIERFVQNLLLLQDSKIVKAFLGHQNNDGNNGLALYLEDTKRGTLTLDYCCAIDMNLHKTDCDVLLKTIIEPKKIIKIGIATHIAGIDGRHALSVYCNSHSLDYFCFDSNAHSGKAEIKKNTKEVVAWLIEKLKEYKSPTADISCFRFAFESERLLVAPHIKNDLKLHQVEIIQTYVYSAMVGKTSLFLLPDTAIDVSDPSLSKEYAPYKKLYGLHLIDALYKENRAWSQQLIAYGATLNESLEIDGQEETVFSVILAKLCENKKPSLEKDYLKVADLTLKSKVSFNAQEKKYMQQLLSLAVQDKRVNLAPLFSSYYFQKACKKNSALAPFLQRIFEHCIAHPDYPASLRALFSQVHHDVEGLVASSYDLLASDCLAISALSVAELLIEQGASIDTRNEERKSCLGVLLERLSTETLSAEKKQRLVRCAQGVLEKGGRLNLNEKSIVSKFFIQALKNGQREYIPLCARYYHQSAYLQKAGHAAFEDEKILVERYFELLFDWYSVSEMAEGAGQLAALRSHISDARGLRLLQDFYGRQLAEAVDLDLFALAKLLLDKSASLYQTLGSTPQDIFYKVFTKLVETPKRTVISPDLLALAQALVRGQKFLNVEEKKLIQTTVAKLFLEKRDELLSLVNTYYKELLMPSATEEEKLMNVMLGDFINQQCITMMNEFAKTTDFSENLLVNPNNQEQERFYGLLLYDLTCAQAYPLAKVLIKKRVNPHVVVPLIHASTVAKTTFHYIITRLLPPVLHQQTTENTIHYLDLLKSLLRRELHLNKECYPLIRTTFKTALKNHYVELARVIVLSYHPSIDEERKAAEKSFYAIAQEHGRYYQECVEVLKKRGADKVQLIIPLPVPSVVAAPVHVAPPLVVRPVDVPPLVVDPVDTSKEDEHRLRPLRPFMLPAVCLLAGVVSDQPTLVHAGVGLTATSIAASLQKKGTCSSKVAKAFGIGLGTACFTFVTGEAIHTLIGDDQFIGTASKGALAAYLGASLLSGAYCAKKSYDYFTPSLPRA